MKKFIVIVLTLVLVLSLFMFTACDEEKETKTKIIIKVPAMGMDVSMVYAGVTSVADFLENMAAAYEAANPGVDIEIAEYEAAKEKKFVEETIDTSSAPDILFNSFYNMRSYAYSGKPVPLDDIFTILTQGKGYEIDEDAVAASTLGGKKYMIPFYSQQYTLAYNYNKLTAALNKLYKATGATAELKLAIDNFRNNTLPKSQEDAKNKIISFSDEEWSLILDNYAALCQDPKSGYSYNYPFMMYAANTQGDSHILTILKVLGADIVKDGQVLMNNENGKNALKYFAEQNAAGVYPAKAENFDINDCIDLFMNGQLLFGICNNALYNQYKELPFGLVNFRGDCCENFYYGFEVFDNGDADKLSVAKDFVKFIYTGEVDHRENIRYSLAGLPVIKNLEEDVNNTNRIVMYKENKANLSKCIGGDKDTYKVISGGITNWNEIRSIFQQEIQELLRGSKTYTQVAESIDQRANTAIAAASGKLHE